jgi:hypothetical protein
LAMRFVRQTFRSILQNNIVSSRTLLVDHVCKLLEGCNYNKELAALPF